MSTVNIAQGRVFNQPFVYLVNNPKVSQYCSFCCRKPGAGKKLALCGSCEFARYCNKECQRAAWKTHHRAECPRLKRSFPNLPLTEVLFMARITQRVLYIEKYGDKHNWQRDRKFDDLMTHREEMLNDPLRMEHFEKIYTKTSAFMGEDMPEREHFFTIFGRTFINSHSIHTMVGDEIGVALDLGVSMYNHCCRPTCSLVFDGYVANLRPLNQAVNVYDLDQAFISYIDVGRSRYLRRKDLAAKWYFHCECSRCLDPADDRLTSLTCVRPDCKGCVITNEEATPTPIACDVCATVAPVEHVKAGIDLMLSMPAKFDINANKDDVDKIRERLNSAKGLLHPENIYYCRTITAYMQLAPDDRDYATPDLHKMVYSQYKQCFPASDRHRGYQMLHLVKSYIEQGRRLDAVPYAFEAMTIFEVCFGLDHPYYLQTLALWTFLKDNRKDKTDAELMGLMQFNYHSRIDMTPYLGKDAMDALKQTATVKEEEGEEE